MWARLAAPAGRDDLRGFRPPAGTGAPSDAGLAAYTDLRAARIDISPRAWCFAEEEVAARAQTVESGLEIVVVRVIGDRMQSDKIVAIFDQQAATYDRRWSDLAPINGALHLLVDALLSKLPARARILCVGAGTGAEVLYFAQRFPGWRFTAVEPSLPMLEVCRRRAEERGVAERCVFHAGYLDSLPPGEPFDAATAFLVSQFIVDREARVGFFRGIVDRLRPGGIMVSSDVSGDLSAPECRRLLGFWYELTAGAGASPDGFVKMREAYGRDLAVLPPEEVREIIARGGFGPPVRFYQAGMIHAWYAFRVDSDAASSPASATGR